MFANRQTKGDQTVRAATSSSGGPGKVVGFGWTPTPPPPRLPSEPPSIMLSWQILLCFLPL